MFSENWQSDNKNTRISRVWLLLPFPLSTTPLPTIYRTLSLSTVAIFDTGMADALLFCRHSFNHVWKTIKHPFNRLTCSHIPRWIDPPLLVSCWMNAVPFIRTHSWLGWDGLVMIKANGPSLQQERRQVPCQRGSVRANQRGSDSVRTLKAL